VGYGLAFTQLGISLFALSCVLELGGEWSKVSCLGVDLVFLVCVGFVLLSLVQMLRSWRRGNGGRRDARRENGKGRGKGSKEERGR